MIIPDKTKKVIISEQNLKFSVLMITVSAYYLFTCWPL